MNRRNFLYNTALVSSGLILSEELLERINHKKIYALGSWKKYGELWTIDGKYVSSAIARVEKDIIIFDFNFLKHQQNIGAITVDKVVYPLRLINVCAGDYLKVHMPSNTLKKI